MHLSTTRKGARGSVVPIILSQKILHVLCDSYPLYTFVLEISGSSAVLLSTKEADIYNTTET